MNSCLASVDNVPHSVKKKASVDNYLLMDGELENVATQQNFKQFCLHPSLKQAQAQWRKQKRLWNEK